MKAKRLFSLFLLTAMVLSLSGGAVFASGDEPDMDGDPASGVAAVYDGDTLVDRYSSLSDAWAKAAEQEEATVSILRDCTGANLTVPADCMLTLDFNGHTVTFASDEVLTVQGTIIFRDSVGGGSMSGGAISGTGSTYVGDTANFTLPGNLETSMQYAIRYMDGGTEKLQLGVQNIADIYRAMETGWYFASGKLTIDTYTFVDCDVRLILTDGCKLTINAPETEAAIAVLGDGSLTIYGQSEGTGTLVANGGANAAGIGGIARREGCSITICGGIVYANGGENGAGIGGGQSGAGTNITITGGTVYAQGGYGGAGIGGGKDANAESITITGGTVTASGGYRGTGIGGGDCGSADGIVISGGTVTANGMSCSAGIGGARFGAGKNITISGGVVTATGGKFGAGIGGGAEGDGSDIKLTGGEITAKGGSEAVAVGGGYNGGTYNVYVAESLPIVVDETEVCAGHTSTTDLADNSEFLQNSLTVGIAAPAPAPTPTTAPDPAPALGSSGGGVVQNTGIANTGDPEILDTTTPATETPAPTESPEPTVTPAPAGQEAEEPVESEAAPSPTETPAEEADNGDTGSVFGGGSVVLLVVGAVLILGGGTAAFVIARKRKAHVK